MHAHIPIIEFSSLTIYLYGHHDTQYWMGTILLIYNTIEINAVSLDPTLKMRLEFHVFPK